MSGASAASRQRIAALPVSCLVNKYHVACKHGVCEPWCGVELSDSSLLGWFYAFLHSLSHSISPLVVGLPGSDGANVHEKPTIFPLPSSRPQDMWVATQGHSSEKPNQMVALHRWFICTTQLWLHLFLRHQRGRFHHVALHCRVS